MRYLFLLFTLMVSSSVYARITIFEPFLSRSKWYYHIHHYEDISLQADGTYRDTRRYGGSSRVISPETLQKRISEFVRGVDGSEVGRKLRPLFTEKNIDANLRKDQARNFKRITYFASYDLKGDLDGVLKLYDGTGFDFKLRPKGFGELTLPFKDLAFADDSTGIHYEVGKLAVKETPESAKRSSRLSIAWKLIEATLYFVEVYHSRHLHTVAKSLDQVKYSFVADRLGSKLYSSMGAAVLQSQKLDHDGVRNLFRSSLTSLKGQLVKARRAQSGYHFMQGVLRQNLLEFYNQGFYSKALHASSTIFTDHCPTGLDLENHLKVSVLSWLFAGEGNQGQADLTKRLGALFAELQSSYLVDADPQEIRRLHVTRLKLETTIHFFNRDLESWQASRQNLLDYLKDSELSTFDAFEVLDDLKYRESFELSFFQSQIIGLSSQEIRAYKQRILAFIDFPTSASFLKFYHSK